MDSIFQKKNRNSNTYSMLKLLVFVLVLSTAVIALHVVDAAIQKIIDNEYRCPGYLKRLRKGISPVGKTLLDGLYEIYEILISCGEHRRVP